MRERLAELGDPDLPMSRRIGLLLEPLGNRGCSFEKLRAMTGLRSSALERAVTEAVSENEIAVADGFYVSFEALKELKDSIIRRVTSHHDKEPLARGIARETLREQTAASVEVEVFRKALGDLESAGTIKTSKDIVALSSHISELSPEEERVKTSLLKNYTESGLQVSALNDAITASISGTSINPPHARKIFQLLVIAGDLLKVSDDYYFSKPAIEKLTSDLREYAETKAENRLIGVPEFKDVANVSRKYAIPLLEYLDGSGITRRAGDKRIVL